MALEIVQARGPEHAVLVEPSIHQLESGRVQGVQAKPGVPSLVDEPRLAEDPEVPGDGRAADGKPASHLASRHLPGTDQVEDGAAGGVAEGGEDWIGGALLRNHIVTC
jgi:hypothetical protein